MNENEQDLALLRRLIGLLLCSFISNFFAMKVSVMNLFAATLIMMSSTSVMNAGILDGNKEKVKVGSIGEDYKVYTTTDNVTISKNMMSPLKFALSLATPQTENGELLYLITVNDRSSDMGRIERTMGYDELVLKFADGTSVSLPALGPVQSSDVEMTTRTTDIKEFQKYFKTDEATLLKLQSTPLATVTGSKEYAIKDKDGQKLIEKTAKVYEALKPSIDKETTDSGRNACDQKVNLGLVNFGDSLVGVSTNEDLDKLVTELNGYIQQAIDAGSLDAPLNYLAKRSLVESLMAIVDSTYECPLLGGYIQLQDKEIFYSNIRSAVYRAKDIRDVVNGIMVAIVPNNTVRLRQM